MPYGRKTKQNWNRESATQYSVRAHRGYSATIDVVGNTITLTIVGSGAPAPTTYDTIGLAKNAYSKFLRTK